MPGSLDLLFRPRGIAVIGASADPRKLGHRIVTNLVEYGFTGAIYPVHPRGGTIGSLVVYSSVNSLPEAVSLALICVPREAVVQVVEQCAEAGIETMVVVTSGFAEKDAEGERLQQLLAAKARADDFLLVGPNCVGVINTDPQVRLNTTFCPISLTPGRVALCSQSGALGVLAVASGERFNLGFSQFVSVGNEAHVSAADLLEYWGADEDTDVILLYLESVSDGPRFREAAANTSRRKPIIAIKAGREEAGQRAARSHTAALASSERAIDALFHQAGIVRAAGLDELLDLAAMFAHQPLPQGRRVGIISNAGGPAVLCADACATWGLDVPRISPQLQQQFADLLVPAAGVANPVDMLASAGPEEYRRAIEIMLGSSEVDAVIVIYVPVEMVANPEFVQAICTGVSAARASTSRKQPVVACIMSQTGERIHLTAADETIPCVVAPDMAARSLGRAVEYSQWRQRPAGEPPVFDDMDFATARRIIAEARAETGDAWLTPHQMGELAGALNLPLLTSPVAATSEQAAELAGEIGFPVAMKTASTKILHKTDIGAVELNLASEEEVRAAFERIRSRLETEAASAAQDGFIVQPMCRGVELIIGATCDPQLGPLLAFGLGGTRVEIIHDMCYRLAPISDRDADEMVRAIRGYPLLTGYRGQPPADIAAIEQLLLRVSRLVHELPEVCELDFNPVVALPPPEGCRIVDARMRVGPTEVR